MTPATIQPTTPPGNEAHVSRPPAYTIYKPNSRGSGGAVSFSLNSGKGAVFVEAANQKGERQFDWENKIIMKWGLSDLGSILSGLRGRQPQVKLFHQTERSNSACALNARENPEQGAPFLFTISRQESADRQVRKVAVTLSESEAAILETALEHAILRILAW